MNWYARWDESANDMVERDASTLQFSAVGNAAAPVTTTTRATTRPTTTKPSSSKQVVLNDVTYGTAYDLTPYNYKNIRSITLQFQNSIAYSDLQNGTITFQIQNPQDVMTIYNYYGLGSLQAVTLNY